MFDKKPEPVWIADEVPAPSENVLWKVVLRSLDKEGFPLGTGLDPATRTATTGWFHSLAPFRKKGYRERAIVKIAMAAPDRYDVIVRVQRDINDDITRPMDLQYARWEGAPDNEQRARIVLHRIRAWLAEDIEVGPEPRPRL
jgi:hypothetical protein